MDVAGAVALAIYAETDLPGVEMHPGLGGNAAVFTSRAPHKETTNEDVAAVIPVSEREGILVVADGLGGGPAGEQASRLAVEIIARSVQGAGEPRVVLREAILEGIEQANREICALGTGAATTLALVEIQDRVIRSYHVGDAMILVTGQRGRIKHQSIAHSPVGYAVEAGLLDEADAVQHEDRHLVSNVLGATDMRVEMGPAVTLAPRDTVVLASDALADNLYVEEIVDAVRVGPLADAAGLLVNRCRARMLVDDGERPCHPDDLTVIAFRPRR